MNRTIASMLMQAHFNKANIIPVNLLSQIEKIIQTKKVPFYRYEVLLIFNYLCYNKDQHAFKVLDNILFPNNNQKWIIQPTLQIAYKRLQCLVKYQAPFSQWVTKVRQLVHDSKLTSTDFKILFSMGRFENLRNDQNFIKLYDELILLLQEQAHKIDVLTLVSLQKHIHQIKTISAQSIQSLLNIYKRTDNVTSTFYFFQLKFLQNAKRISQLGMFLYFLKSCSYPLRKYGLLYILIHRNFEWKQWAFNRFTRKQIIQKLPTTDQQEQINKTLIVDNLAHQNKNKRKIYIDQYFQFEFSQKDGKKTTSLKNPKQEYLPFLMNAFYFFDSISFEATQQQYQRISQVIQNTTYLKKTATHAYMYLSVKLALISIANREKEAKIKQQTQTIKQCVQLLRGAKVLDYYIFNNFKLHPTRAFKHIASLQTQIYELPQFKQLFDKINKICAQIYKTVLKKKQPTKYKQMQSIIKQYMVNKSSSNKQKLFYGHSKKYILEQQGWQIYVSKSIQLNNIILVDKLIRVKDSKTSKQIKVLIDYKNFVEQQINQYPNRTRFALYWKQKYIIDWCKLPYLIQRWSPTQQYINSDKFKNYIKSLLI